MISTDKLSYVRSHFSHLEKKIIYLNHAAIAPLSIPVKNAIHSYVDQRVSTNIENYPELMQTIEETLENIASLINASPGTIEFVPNTSYGLNVLVQGLDWKEGDRIIVPSCEFPANVYPFQNLKSLGVKIDFVPHKNGTFKLSDVEALITPATRLVTVSWVQFLSGFRCSLPEIGAICKAHNILFCVDGIQGMGALQIDVTASGIDFFSTGGHKWLLSTQGVGFIYAAPPLLEKLKPSIGWLNGPVDWENLTNYTPALFDDASKFRLGTLNSIGIYALSASLNMYRDFGPAWCESHLLEITKYLREGMSELGFKLYGSDEERHLSGISTFIHAEADQVYEKLKEHKIYIALRNKMLRFAPGYYTSREDLDKVFAVLSSNIVA